MFAKFKNFFAKPTVSSPSREEVEELIVQAVFAVQENLSQALEDPEPLRQIHALGQQVEQLNTEVCQLRMENARLADEVQLQIAQVSQLPLLPQVKTLAQQVDSLTQSFTQTQAPMQQALSLLESQFQTQQQELVHRLSQLHEEIPEQAQISALVEQVVRLQADLGKWQRTFSQELEQVHQTLRLLKEAPPTPSAPLPTASFESYFNAGKILLLSGDTLPALQNLESALKLDAQSADAWYLLAVAQSQAEQIEQAVISLEQAIQLNPAKRALARTSNEFLSLVGNARFEQVVGSTRTQKQGEEAIQLPQVDLASLFDV
ncbi:TPR end-of-group domain-containing protein [Anthocerotibacter panamensis]|uniref:TPR end-of-group domain-containing protein n=1 Tax=Anthocerotibacter panamensis TaxID=2857077 RepID=UPI001C402682|nr:tetratricopeptide repeat protein [Anthocerotibacter panamensis]